MSNKYLFTVVLMLFALSSPVIASEGGSHTSGGGERKGSKLRDLVDGGTCIIELGKDFAAKHAKMLPGILGPLKKANWALGVLIQEEIKHLRFCVVDQELQKTVVTDDPDSRTFPNESADKHLIAIREDELVYVNRAQFVQLDPQSRAAFLIHEAMHAYVPMHTSRHNDKVRNIVRAIVENARSPMTDEQFELQMEYASMRDCIVSIPYRAFENPFLILFEEQPTLGRARQIAAAREIIMTNDHHDDDCFQALAAVDLACTTTLGQAAVWMKIQELLMNTNTPRTGRRPGVEVGKACYGEKTRKYLEDRYGKQPPK